MNREVTRGLVSIVRSIYQPSVDERKIKSRLHRLYSEGATKSKLTIEMAEAMLGVELTKKDDPAFCAWLFNTKEVAETTITAHSLIMSKVLEKVSEEDVTLSDLLKAGTMMNDAMKILMPKVVQETADKQINDMSPKELAEYIKDHTP